jgi:hypothetical protein
LGLFFHELAHAIIHTNNVPVTGREEDVAEQFAVWYAVNFVDLSQNPIVMPTIWFWLRLAKERDIPSMSEQERRSFMSNECSLDEQRIYNMACWERGPKAGQIQPDMPGYQTRAHSDARGNMPKSTWA